MNVSPEIQVSVAHGIDSVTGCGSGMFIMLFFTCISIAFGTYMLVMFLRLFHDSMKSHRTIKGVLADEPDRKNQEDEPPVPNGG